MNQYLKIFPTGMPRESMIVSRANGAEVTSPGQRPGYRASSRHPPCRGGGSLRPYRARYIRLLALPRALPWASIRRRFQRRKMWNLLPI